MDLTPIPFLLMRGGTSRGPYMRRSDLPSDEETLAKVLIAAIGGGHPLNIDGIGGGSPVSTKVAMLSGAADGWADVDYFFGQVAVGEKSVDFKPTCGNILSGVGPAAIEMGLVAASAETTEVRIRAVNTGARVLARVETPDGRVAYGGTTAIDGVPGTAAPITLRFMDVAGSSTGALLPTGAVRDTIDGIDVTCMDVAVPMVIAKAADFGISGYESRERLDGNAALLAGIEAVRVRAGEAMGLGDVATSVVPKFGLVAQAKEGGTIAARYFMPWKAHPTMAVTGAQCLAACALSPGSVADGLLERPAGSPVTVTLEHPGGTMDVIIDYTANGEITVHSAGLVRTARKLAAGELFVPASLWPR